MQTRSQVRAYVHAQVTRTIKTDVPGEPARWCTSSAVRGWGLSSLVLEGDDNWLWRFSFATTLSSENTRQGATNGLRPQVLPFDDCRNEKRSKTKLSPSMQACSRRWICLVPGSTCPLWCLSSTDARLSATTSSSAATTCKAFLDGAYTSFTTTSN